MLNMEDPREFGGWVEKPNVRVCGVCGAEYEDREMHGHGLAHECSMFRDAKPIVESKASYGPNTMEVHRQRKCGRGEHEAGDIVLLRDLRNSGVYAYIKADGVSLAVCKHCRSVYVERS